MNFEMAYFLSGFIVVFFLGSSLVVYGNSIRKVFGDITPSTKSSLIFLGAGGIVMTVTLPLTLVILFMVLGAVSLMYGMFSLALTQIVFPEEKKGKRLSIGIGVIVIVAFVTNFIEQVFNIPILIAITGAATGILFIVTLILAVLLVRETRTAFTISIFILTMLTLLLAYLASNAVADDLPQLFILQMAPYLLAAAIFGSILRPWRYILTYFFGFVLITTGISLVYGAIMGGSEQVLLFASVAMFAGLCTLVPLNHFIIQALDSRARTPRYISIVLTSIIFLVINHTISFAIYQVQGLVWDRNVVLLDMFFGSIAISTFLLVSLSAGGYSRALTFARTTMIVVSSALVALNYPYIANDRWIAGDFFPVLGIFIAIGIAVFTYVAYDIYKSGATRAATNLLLFMVASLFLGLVVMASDIFPFNITIFLLITAGILQLGSSPQLVKAISIRLTRQDSDIPEMSQEVEV